VSKKSIFTMAAVAAGLMISVMTQATQLPDKTIDITATVDTYAEWDSTNTYSIAATDFSGKISRKGDTITVSHPLLINTNTDVTLHMVAGANSGILKDTSNPKIPLTTSYKLSGDAVPAAAGNGAFKDAANALGDSPFDAANDYTLPIATAVAHNGTCSFNLEVQAVNPAGTYYKAGDYTCGIVIQVSW